MLFHLIGISVIAYVFFYFLILCFIDCDFELWLYTKFGKSPKTLKGSVVCVTGASSGIGENIAKALAKNCVKLALTARRKNELERVKRECIKISNGELSETDILVRAFDITDFSQHQNFIDQILHHFGRLDILVNNAGRSQRALFEKIQMTVDRQMFELNVFSVVHLSRIALEYFNERGSGHIAVISSSAGFSGAPFSSTYTATKHALHGYFDALRLEKNKQNITVSLLCPGPTFTNFLQECFTERDGQKYGISVKKNDWRMTAERCGELCAVALANRMEETWIAARPLVLIFYWIVYCPNFSRMVMKMIERRHLLKMRDLNANG